MEKPSREELVRRYAPPLTPQQAERVETLRTGVLGLAQIVADLTPPGHRQQGALEALDDVLSRARAAIEGEANG